MPLTLECEASCERFVFVFNWFFVSVFAVRLPSFPSVESLMSEGLTEPLGSL